MEMVYRKAKKSNRLTLLLLLLVFGLPPLAGWIYYLNPQWLPTGRSNHGVLIDPPHKLQDITLSDMQGRSVDWDSYRNFWALAVVSRGACAADCRQQLAVTGQVLRAIGASRTRVKQLLILLPSDVDGKDAAAPEGAAEGVDMVRVQGAAAQEIATRFDLNSIDPAQTIFVIAPDSTLMMRHDLATVTPKQVMQDLEILLTASQNWVRGT